MVQRNDTIFQLSLTEIAFIITFILLLLLGYLVFKEQTDRKIAEDTLKKIQSAESAEAKLIEAKSSLDSALQKAGASNPDEAIDILISSKKVLEERDSLKQQVEDLDAALTSLTELKRQTEKVAQSNKPGIILKEVESALSLQNQVRKALVEEGSASSPTTNTKISKEQQNKDEIERVKDAITATRELKKQLKEKMGEDLKHGQETQAIQDLVAAAKSYSDIAMSGVSPDQIKKENADLRGQITFLKNKMEANGGRDYPPCWADEATGKVEFLFSVEVTPDSVLVMPAWPPNREADAHSLPGLAGLISGSLHSYVSFVKNIQGIFNKSQECQCRHYVRLKSSIPDAVQSDRARLMVENYFYKIEVRR